MAVGIVEASKTGDFTFSVIGGKGLKEADVLLVQSGGLDTVYFIAEPDGAMLYEIAVPVGIEAKNVESVLQGELSYRLPVDFNSVVWAYRKTADGNYKALVVKREEYERLLRLLSGRGVCCDFFYPKQLLEGDGLPNDLVPVSLVIPKELRPVRYRTWKLLYFLLLLLAMTMLVTIAVGKYRMYRTEYDKLTPVANQLAGILKQEQKRFGKLNTEQELLEKIKEQRMDLNPLLPILLELTRKLPDYMWITNYVQNGNMIDVTIESGKDEANFYRLLGESALFQLVNLRKSRGANDTTIFYAKLKGGGL